MGTGVDALPYVDALIKEYLLFRGFTATLSTFNKDLAADPGCGFQAERITDLIFRQLIPGLDCQQLVEFLEYLNMQLYSRLDSRYEPLVSAVEADLLRLFLVTAHNARRPDKMADFFRLYGSQLISNSSRGGGAGSSGPLSAQDTAAADWREWFLLPYLQNPEREPRFQLYFTSEWAALLEVSFRNFIAGVVRSLPLPAVLRFNTDRRLRLALQQQVHALQAELERTKEQLAVTVGTLEHLQQLQGAKTSDALLQQERPSVCLSIQTPPGAAGDAARQQQQQQQLLLPEQEQSQVPQAEHAVESPQHRREASLVDWQATSSTGADRAAAAAAAAGGGDIESQKHVQASSSMGRPVGGSGLFELLPQHSTALTATSIGGQAAGHHHQQHLQQQQQQEQPQVVARHARGQSFSGSISFDAPSAGTAAAGDSQVVSSRELSMQACSEEDAAAAQLYEQSSREHHQGKAAAAGRASGRDETAPQPAAALHLPALSGAVPIVSPSPRTSPTPRSSSGSTASGAPLSSSPVLSWAGGVGNSGVGVRPRHQLTAGHTPGGHATSSGSNSSNSSGTAVGVGFTSVPPVAVQVLPALSAADSSVTVSYQQHLLAGAPDAAGSTGLGGNTSSSSCVTAVAFSPSGANIASVVSGSSNVHIWSPTGLPGNAARAAVVSCGAPVTCVAWDSRADKLMLIGCGGAGGVRAWHADTRRIMDRLAAEPGFPVVAAVAACPSEPTFVVAANSSSGNGSDAVQQQVQGRLVSYNARSFKRSSVFVVPGDVGLASLTYSSTGNQLFVGTAAGTALLFEPNSRSSPIRVWHVAAAVAPRSGSGSAATAAAGPSSTAGLSVQVLWRPAGAQGSSSGSGSAGPAVVRATTPGVPGAAAAAAGRGSSGSGGGTGVGTLLTLCGGVLCEWALSLTSRTPIVAIDVVTTAKAVLAEQQQQQQQDPLHAAPDDMGAHCCAAVAPDGSGVAVLCSFASAGVLMLLVCERSDRGLSWPTHVRVLLQGTTLAGCIGAVSFHSGGKVLAIGSREATSLTVCLKD